MKLDEILKQNCLKAIRMKRINDSNEHITYKQYGDGLELYEIFDGNKLTYMKRPNGYIAIYDNGELILERYRRK